MNKKINCNLAKGVSLRKNKKGEATSIQITFTYKGVLCRERLGFQLNTNGVKAAEHLLGEIKNRIAQNKFFYAEYFPNSKKLQIFSNSTSNASVIDYLNTYITKAQKRGLASSTITGYEKAKNGLSQLWNIPVAELESLQIINFIESSNLSRKTIANRLSLLRSALNRAVVDNLIKVNPASGFRAEEYIVKNNKINLRNAHEDVKPFNPSEAMKIIKEASNTIKPIVALLFDTGIRSSEWVALKKDDVCLISKKYQSMKLLSKVKLKAPRLNLVEGISLSLRKYALY